MTTNDPELSQAILRQVVDAPVPTSVDPWRFRWLTAGRAAMIGIVLFGMAGLMVIASVVVVARAQGETTAETRLRTCAVLEVLPDPDGAVRALAKNLQCS